MRTLCKSGAEIVGSKLKPDAAKMLRSVRAQWPRLGW